MKSLISSIVAGVLLTSAIAVNANTTKTIDPAAPWLGFMNVFELPSNGGGYVYGEGWGPADLVATFSGSTMKLSPNTVGDTNSFWYTPMGQPGATGNKIMEANMYVETNDGSLSGQTLTFTGNVIANTLANSHTAVAFIKDFMPDYSSFTVSSVPLSGTGVFSISLATAVDPTHHVQYGLQVTGPDVWVTDVAPYGNVQIAPVGGTPTSVAITPSLSSGTLSLSFPTQNAVAYTVQYKTNFTDASWSTLTVTNGTGSTAVVTDPATNVRRFYRLSIQ
jgi:hypothetical protein